MTNNKVEDIFEDTDKVGDNKSAKSQKRQQSTSLPVQNLPPKQTVKVRSKAPFFVLIVFVVVVLVGIGVVLTGDYFTNDDSGSADIENSASTVTTTNTDSTDSESIDTDTGVVNQAPTTVDDNKVNITQPLDTDGDGLLNNEEIAIGTNPNLKDTDGDSLFDREEVKVYLTDPLKADTDGDGNSDGQEIDAGTNPNGPGLLLDLEKEKLNL